MSAFLYNLGIKFYYIAIYLASFFNSKAKKWIKGRKGIFRNIEKLAQEKNLVWFHCASLGEFDQGIPIMEKFKEKYPSSKIVVTFFSPSGMEHYHKRNHPADYVYYLPIDTKKNAVRWFQILPIQVIFFVKYEFWANYIFEAKRKNIPLFSVSAIFRPEQVYFKNKNGFFARILQSFDAFFVQNENSKKLLSNIGIKNISICGDTRFDRVIQHKQHAKENHIIGEFLSGKKAIILGSSWAVDELFMQNFILNHPNEKFIIAPHQIDEKHIHQIEQLFPNRCVRYTQWNENRNAHILLLDTIGMLSNAYQYGKIAYVGGGFTGKLHNILEPAVFGLPVLFGPKHKRFPEAQAFIDEGFGFELKEEKDIAIAVGSIQDTAQMKLKISNFITQHTGAAAKIIENLPDLKTLTSNRVF